MLIATHGNRVIVACVFGHVIVAADDCSVILSDCLIATKCQVAIGLVLNRVATGCLCGIGSHDVSVANHDGIFTAKVSPQTMPPSAAKACVTSSAPQIFEITPLLAKLLTSTLFTSWRIISAGSGALGPPLKAIGP